MTTDIEKAFDDAIEKATAEGKHVQAIALKQQRWRANHWTDNQGRVHDIETPETPDATGDAAPEPAAFGNVSQGAIQGGSVVHSVDAQVSELLAAGKGEQAIALRQEHHYQQRGQ